MLRWGTCTGTTWDRREILGIVGFLVVVIIEWLLVYLFNAVVQCNTGRVFPHLLYPHFPRGRV